MPAKSKAQYNYMQMIAHGGTPHKGVGPSPAVAKEFVMKTSTKKRKEWSK